MNKRTKKVKAEAFIRTTTIRGGIPKDDPLWSLPRTAESYDQMVEQCRAEMAKIYDAEFADVMRKYHEQVAKLTLRAIGITRPEEATK